MFKFNNTHIFTGYIKQLLHEFNLPKYQNGHWTSDEVANYTFNEKIFNRTKNLIIKNNIYDTYTHEYLGEYLRFYRDFTGINLMPLYNCFSDKICTNLKIRITDETNTTSKPRVLATFDSSDTGSKIYMLPVRTNTAYTIAIDSSSTVEICCGAYGEYQANNINILAKQSYKKFNNLVFSNPQLYTTIAKPLTSDNADSSNDFKDEDLKLFIKLPITCNSSIVVLEGDYRCYQDTICSYTSGVLSRKTNNFVVNFRPMIDKDVEADFQEDQPFEAITPLQLLSMNTGVSAPFADRLIEYLTGNAITEDDYFSDDIERAQVVAKLFNAPIMKGKGDTYRQIDINYTKFDIIGGWSNKLRAMFYSYMQNGRLGNGKPGSLNTWTINHDILGYGDKTVEKYFRGITLDRYGHPIIKNGKHVYTTLNNVDIYPESYLDSKEK